MRRQDPERQKGWLADVFQSLSADERAVLERQATVYHLQAGETLPEVHNALIRVEEGLARLFVTDKERMLTVGLLGPRDSLAAPLYHNWSPSIYGVQAQEESHILVVPHEAVFAVADANPNFYRELIRHLSWGVWFLMERLQSLVFSTLRERVCRVLLNIGLIMGTPKNGGVHLGLRMTQEELAELVGTRRESLSATLQELREDGIIELRYARIDIKDLKALHRITGDDALPFVEKRVNGKGSAGGRGRGARGRATGTRGARQQEK
ncbi:MAG: Crp/Fnr family transcriptional regulator [Armatimonadetes bacterium]|nr:Crp/Fnr family transcriptional regulator [Armatimonadota bacterium]